MDAAQPITTHEPLRRSGGVLLVGTAGTLAAAAAQVAASPTVRRQVFGAVLVPHDGEDDASDPWIGGIPLLGDLANLAAIAEKARPDLALVCIPLAMHAVLDRVRADLHAVGVPDRFLPTVEDVLLRSGDEPAAWSGPARLNMAELVGRPPRPADQGLTGRVVADKRVLITGAGGSIGSELARICAAHGPASLILMDRSDNALFEIDAAIARQHPDVPRRAVLHDVVNAERTAAILAEHRPDVVFHAAAHKHVPLMEDHPALAVQNNFLGTKAVVDAALAADCERFVMVSTDKAVNPSSVMGATKRLAEMYVRDAAARPGSDGSALAIVRFGNVLGSACSVLPIWSAQLAEGGPVTVTDPRMTRFFMTIPEAATLVVQAAGVASPGESRVFVLDMGAPIRILDLAERFVRAHGIAPIIEGDSRHALPRRSPMPGAQVRIVFTGARPGEKLSEELVYDAESLSPTPVPGVQSWSGSVPDRAALARTVERMRAIVDEPDAGVVIAAIRDAVPEFASASAGSHAVSRAVEPASGVRAAKPDAA